MYFSVYFATKKLVCDSAQSLSRVNLANKFIRRHRLFFFTVLFLTFGAIAGSSRRNPHEEANKNNRIIYWERNIDP